MGDFNAHHSLWSSVRSNSAGSTLCEFIDSLNLFCLNPDSMPTFLSHPISIDLVFSSSDISFICNINIDQDLMDSDYFPVFVTINSTARFVNIFFNRIRLFRDDALRSGSQNTLRKLLRKLLWQFFLSLRKKITIPSSTASSLASAKNSTKSYSKTQHHNGESPSPGTPAGPLIPECNKAIRSSLSPFPSLSLKT